MSEHPPSEFTRVAGRLWACALEGVHLRLELLALEVGDERRRLTGVVLSALVAVFAAFTVLVSLNVALLVLCWDTHREAVAIGSCVFYAALAVAAALGLRRFGRRTTAPFAALTKILADDERALRDLL